MADSNQGFNPRVIDEFRSNDGTVSAAGFGRSLVLLHHLGAKSGTERVSPVRALNTDHGTWLVAASKGGAPENPAWYHNLRAHPDITIETPDDGTVAVHSDELIGAARNEAWDQFTAASPGFKQYEQQTSRTIPVLELRRR